MLKITEYLKNNSLQKLEDEFAIHIKRHPKYPNLVLLKYDQLNTPMNSITRECRGIILDETNSWYPVCYTYKRFQNLGEGWGDKLDWLNVRAYEKLDGSLCQLYYYDNQWQVASSGLPDAGGNVLNTATTFAELFWKVWGELGYKLPTNTDRTFAFELMTPFNRVVVRHKINRLVLHGARRMSDLRELNPIIEAHTNEWECVKIFPLQTPDEIIEAANKLDPINEGEGFVACDINYNRAKVKGLPYKAMAHMKDGLSTRSILNNIRVNESSEFLAGYEEYYPIFYEVGKKYYQLLGEIEGFYDGIKHIDNRKEFAMMAIQKPYSGGLFNMKFGKINTFKEYLRDMNIKQLEDWLDIGWIKL